MILLTITGSIPAYRLRQAAWRYTSKSVAKILTVCWYTTKPVNHVATIPARRFIPSVLGATASLLPISTRSPAATGPRGLHRADFKPAPASDRRSPRGAPILPAQNVPHMPARRRSRCVSGGGAAPGRAPPGRQVPAPTVRPPDADAGRAPRWTVFWRWLSGGGGGSGGGFPGGRGRGSVDVVDRSLHATGLCRVMH